MRRYLIHHGDGETWDLVVIDKVWLVERVGLLSKQKQSFSLAEFEKSSMGLALWDQLNDAMARALKE